MTSPADLSVKMSPQEYLDYAAKVSVTPSSALPGGQWAEVKGDVDVSSHPSRDIITSLPPADIHGSLLAKGCRSLRFVECGVSGTTELSESSVEWVSPDRRQRGMFNAEKCENLTELSGDFDDRVNLSGSPIVHLGADFSCRGDLVLEDCRELRVLSCRVGRSLLAERSGLEELSSSFFCTGDLKLTDCPRLHRLGNLAAPPRDVFLSGSGIVEILPDFHCQGALIMRNVDRLQKLSGTADTVDVERAPRLREVSDLHVAYDLSLTECPRLKKLEFVARDNVTIHQCAMEEIHPAAPPLNPASMIIRECPNFRSIGGKWSCELSLINLKKLRQTAPDFHCTGNLLIRSCPAFAKFEGRADGIVTLSQITALRELPSSLKVGGNLVLGCPDLQISSVDCRIGGDLIMMGCRTEFSTGPSLHVAGAAMFHECPGLRSLSGWVGGKVSVRNGCGLIHVGADFECGDTMLLSDCANLKNLNCRVGRDVLIERSTLWKTGPAFTCAGSFSLHEVTGVRSLHGTVGGSCDIPFVSLTRAGADVRISRPSPPVAPLPVPSAPPPPSPAPTPPPSPTL